MTIDWPGENIYTAHNLAVSLGVELGILFEWMQDYLTWTDASYTSERFIQWLESAKERYEKYE